MQRRLFDDEPPNRPEKFTGGVFTKEYIIQQLIKLTEMGWIPSARQGNAGGVGNTIEDVLGIPENNLPIPNAAEWELKSARLGSKSLTTLIHLEPSPQASRLVAQMLLPKYGWAHKQAGGVHPISELSFRQTINAGTRTDRGFGIEVDRESARIVVSFDAHAVSPKHADWLESVKQRAGLGDLPIEPYWGFEDLYTRIAAKLHNCFYVLADSKVINGVEHFKYENVYMLERLSREKFIESVERGIILVDFDARTGHNHGTKFRIRPGYMTSVLYERVEVIRQGRKGLKTR